MPTGSLLAAAVLAGGAAPLPGVRVTVLDESGVTAAALLTGSEGRAEAPALPAPRPEPEPGPGQHAAAVCRVHAAGRKRGLAAAAAGGRAGI